MLKKSIYLSLGAIVSALVLGLAVLWWLIAFNPGEAIQQENIEKILAMESPVYYSDGQNKIGVFFEQAHRQYIPYNQVPKDFINAIVAAEDRNFFHHYGVDFFGIFRAMVANIRAGRIVQGGSTITQQTAKNLFKRKERSIAAKLKELLYAWRLEYHYPKKKILEFYANQFYVSGNGRGLGVAARYYFDKSVEDLDVLECAFIAGSVKRPNFYNPFIKKNEELAMSARDKAKSRVGYVLGQMYKQGMLDVNRYQEHIGRDIPFQQGQMYYSLNTIMDLVKAGLAEPEVEEAFSQHGIDNVATSGIRVVTTVEKDLQENAFHSLRKELSRLDVRLRGYDRESLQKVYADLRSGGEAEMRPGGFLLARVATIDRSSAPFVEVFLGKNGQPDGPRGRIDQAGLMNILVPLVKYQKQRWSQASNHDLREILDLLEEGDLVYVSVKDVDSFTGEYLLDLEKYPELQGAALALQKGTIRAMVGGKDNRYYNRAVAAKRSMGSIIKPLVYSAALQLGWNSMDILNNQRNVFVFQNKPYFPRPDHESPHRGVSMSWAGVHSENLASVWLLYHMCDHLAPAQFKEVIDNLGLGPQPGESHVHYRSRIRDQFGIVVRQESLYRAAFEKALVSIEPDLLFAGKFAEHEALQTFHYGAGFDKFLWAEEDVISEDVLEKVNEKVKAEKKLRISILKKNYLRFKQLQEEMLRLGQEVKIFSNEYLPINLFYNSSAAQFVYGEQPQGDGWEMVSRSKLRNLLRSLDAEKQQKFWDTVLIEGLLTSSTIDLLDNAVSEEYKRLSSLPPYSLEVLFHVRDFKVLVALRYLTGLCREIGIESELEPVLSFPLGSNVISILEVAMAYEGLSTGSVTKSGRDEEAGDGLMIIKQIEDSDGEIIYSPNRSTKAVIDPKVSIAVSDILRNVVKFGTGRYADRNVRLHSRDPEKEQQLLALDLRMPVFGKTGTANRFTNAGFAGIVPGQAEGGKVSLENGYALAVYVGFDDNTPMVRNTTHLTGSSGALPLWTKLANAIFLERDYASTVDLADFSFAGLSEIPLVRPDIGQIVLEVDTERGGTVGIQPSTIKGLFETGKAAITTFGEISRENEVQPSRFFKPYWQMKEN